MYMGGRQHVHGGEAACTWGGGNVLTCNPKTHAHQCAAITRNAVLVANVIVACDRATRANTRAKTREARTRRTSFLCSPGLESGLGLGLGLGVGGRAL